METTKATNYVNWSTSFN